ncbi:unnamed protein product [Trifolium pratense]|uniref:Uncharacterized protein n=1 Tax=Trifolium pratense TaxID=57577 RepID=A0ACB0LV18_TRIPR|nr:unnamed protein product [Trifolium pratense]
MAAADRFGRRQSKEGRRRRENDDRREFYNSWKQSNVLCGAAKVNGEGGQYGNVLRHNQIMQHSIYGEEQPNLRNRVEGKEKDTYGRDGGFVNHGKDGFDVPGTDLKRIASFNRNDRMEEARPETGRHVLMKDNGKLARKEGDVVVSQSMDLKRNGLRKDTKTVQASRGDVNVFEPVKGDTGELEAVRVGDVEVTLRAGKDHARRHNVKLNEGGTKPVITALSNVAIKEKDHQVLIRSYRAEPDDVSWAQNESYQSDFNGGQGDQEVRRQIDTMVENLAKGVEEAGDIGSEENFPLSYNRGVVDSRSEKEVLERPDIARVFPSIQSSLGDSPISGGRQDSNSCCSPITDACGSPGVAGGQGVEEVEFEKFFGLDNTYGSA